jgi:RecA/RadA recombinase
MSTPAQQAATDITAAMEKLKQEIAILKEKMTAEQSGGDTSQSGDGETDHSSSSSSSSSSTTKTLTAAQLSRSQENRKRALRIRKERQQMVGAVAAATNSSRKKQKVSHVQADRGDFTAVSVRKAPYQRSDPSTEGKQISFMCAGLDELLGGGVGMHDFLEIHGPSGSGKTQFVHQLLASIVVSNANDKAVLIDTASGFRPQRVLDIAFGTLNTTTKDTNGISKQSLLDRIQYAACARPDQLEELVRSIGDRSDSMLPRIVVVDNIIKLYRCGNKNTRKTDTVSLSSVMQTLQSLSQRGVSIVVVNEVTADFNAKMGSTKKFKPAGGQRISKYLTARFQLTKARNASGYRKCSRMESDHSVVEDFAFAITQDGIRGAHD